MSLAPEHLKTLTTVSTEFEASAINSALESEGIRTRSVGGYISGFREGIDAGVSILVAESDLPRAQKLLDELRRHGADVDWSQVDVDRPDDEAAASDKA
jgi:hypothetical protein